MRLGRRRPRRGGGAGGLDPGRRGAAARRAARQGRWRGGPAAVPPRTGSADPAPDGRRCPEVLLAARRDLCHGALRRRGPHRARGCRLRPDVRDDVRRRRARRPVAAGRSAAPGRTSAASGPVPPVVALRGRSRPGCGRVRTPLRRVLRTDRSDPGALARAAGGTRDPAGRGPGRRRGAARCGVRPGHGEPVAGGRLAARAERAVGGGRCRAVRRGRARRPRRGHRRHGPGDGRRGRRGSAG